MQDRFKFRAIVKGYYYIDTPEKCEEIEPLIFLENVDVLNIGDIGLSEEDLEIAIRKQYSELSDIYIERILENFRDNSNGIDAYITITPERVYQCTGLKDKNGKLIYEGDIISENWHKYILEWGRGDFQLRNFAKGSVYTFPAGICIEKCEIIGNIYENPELLED